MHEVLIRQRDIKLPLDCRINFFLSRYYRIQAFLSILYLSNSPYFHHVASHETWFRVALWANRTCLLRDQSIQIDSGNPSLVLLLLLNQHIQYSLPYLSHLHSLHGPLLSNSTSRDRSTARYRGPPYPAMFDIEKSHR